MSMRISRSAVLGMLVVAIVVMMSGRSWAIRYGLGPSQDDWGLQYDVAVTDANSDTLNVEFTLSDEGRLKPIYSIELVAFSQQTDRQGGRSYDVKEPIELEKNKDGARVGTVQLPKQFAGRAMIRIITLNVDGKRQPSGGAFYDIPIAKYLKKGQAPPSVASPPAKSKVTK